MEGVLIDWKRDVYPASESGMLMQYLNKIPKEQWHAVCPNGENFLHYACDHPDNLDAAKALIDYGVDVNHADNFGWQPIHCAACRAPEIVKLLCETGRVQLSAQTDEGLTAVDYALERIFQ